MFRELWNSMTFPEHLSDYSKVLRKIRAFISCFSYVWNCVNVFIFLWITLYLFPDACKVLVCKLFKLPDIIVTTTTIITTISIIINNCIYSSVNKDGFYLNTLTWASLICKFSFGALDFVSWKKPVFFCRVSVTTYSGKQAVTFLNFIMFLWISFFVVLSWVKNSNNFRRY